MWHWLENTWSIAVISGQININSPIWKHFRWPSGFSSCFHWLSYRAHTDYKAVGKACSKILAWKLKLGYFIRSVMDLLDPWVWDSTSATVFLPMRTPGFLIWWALFCYHEFNAFCPTAGIQNANTWESRLFLWSVGKNLRRVIHFFLKRAFKTGGMICFFKLSACIVYR